MCWLARANPIHITEIAGDSLIYTLILNTIKKMTTKEIADRLVSMCRSGKTEEAKEELFAPGIVSIEPYEGILPKETRGMDAIRKKAGLFVSMVEDFYGDTISEPVVAGDYFSLSWTSDLQMKGEVRKVNSELCVYQTRDGKIISEQFFY